MFRKVNVPINAIAVGSVEDENGVFELNFHDERYLPFEGAGAISKWRLELPKDICPRCKKKKPPFLSTCPHCGYYPGDPIELAEIEAEKKRILDEANAASSAAAFAPPEP